MYNQIKVRIHKYVAVILLAAFFGPVSVVVAPEVAVTKANAALSVPTSGGAYFNKAKLSYFTISANSNFAVSANEDFTLAWWQYSTDTSYYPRLFNFGPLTGTGSFAISEEGTNFYLWKSGSYTGSSFTTTSATILNTWAHYAIVRQSNTLKIYQNGIQVTSTTWSDGFGSSTDPIYIGTNLSYSADQKRVNFGGYLTAFEFIKGTAKYTGSDTVNANFTPARTQSAYTSSVTAGTKLLLFPTNSSTLFTDYSNSGTTYTFTNVANDTTYNSVTYGNPNPTNYVVTFDGNGATSGSASAASVTQGSSGASVTLATQGTLARTGYTFAGWNTAANPVSNAGNISAGSTYTPDGDTTLYAQWNSTVTYDANGATSGTAPTSTTAYATGAVNTLALNSGSLAKTGYTFGGWNTLANGNGSSYVAGSTSFPSPGNTTLYAQWNSVVSYRSNGSTSGTIPNDSALRGASGNLATNVYSLAKTNFTLGGWNTNESGTGTSYALGETITPSGNMTLYAQWVSLITYDGNSPTTGAAPASTTITAAGGNIATNSGSLTKTSKVFAGWNTNAAGTGTWYSAGAAYSNIGNLTLYARWVDSLSFTGPTAVNVAQGTAFRSDTYTATAGLDTKTVTYTLSPTNSGITLETSTVTGTTYAYIRTSALVPTGTYTETLTATDRAGFTTSLIVTLIVNSPMQFASGTPSTLRSSFGTAKQQRIEVTGGFSGKTFTLTTGSNYSKGITLDTSTAASGYVTLRISGQTAEGVYLETITATDATGRVITNLISVTVGAPISFVRSGVVFANAYSSVKFDGTSQYLNMPGSSRYQVGSKFTVEWWQYQTGGGDSATVFGFGPNWGIYFDSNGTQLREKMFAGPQTLASNLVPANYKNKWTHFALVQNGNTGYIYMDGVAMNPTALNMSISTIDANQVPSTSPLCIATRCTTGTTGDSGYYFGGMIANLSISKRVDYTGTDTKTANFTPSTSLKIDSMTVLALTGINSNPTLSDISPFVETVTANNSPIGTYEYPKRTGITPVVVESTDGRPASPSAMQATNGETNMPSMTMSSNTPGLSFSTFNLYFAVDGSYANTNLLSSVTSIDSVTARVTYDTLTATDPYGGTAKIPFKFTVNPRLQLAATTMTLTTPALVAAYDTITATFGTGNRQWTTVNSLSSGISKTYPTNSQTVIKVGPTTPMGTYYETVTVSDERGDTETIVITVIVTPGLTLTAADSVTSISTTKGIAKSLRINSANGSGAKTYSLTHVALGSLYITLDTSTAGSDYVTLNIANNVNAGSYTERITVTDAVGSTTSLDIYLTVNAAPTISYAGSTSGAITLTTTAGTSITSGAFTAALGTGTRTLALSGLNTGITLDTSTVNVGYVTAGSSLSATNSTTARSYNETITVTDSLTATAFRAFTVTVNPAISLTASAVSLTTTSGVAISDTITATYGTGNKTFAITSSPSIAGITNTTNVTNQTKFTVPNTVGAGTYTITITATDSVGATSSINVTLTVNGAINVTGSSAIAMTAGYAYSSGTYAVTGGTGTYSYVLTGTLNSSYISVETLTASSFRLKITSGATAATYYETVTVSDVAGGTALALVTLTVNPVVTLTGNPIINGTFGVGTSTVYQTSGGTAPFNIFGSSSCAPVATTDGAYTVLTFLGIGTCTWTVPNGVSTVDALVVGGGGSGGSRHGGGGGAGGYNYSTGITTTAGSTKTIVVGGGGAAIVTPGTGTQGNSGSGSQFDSISVSGGGGGGQSNTNGLGYTGGSGGGSTYLAVGGSGTAGQGNNGGNGSYGSSEANWSGGGGGGAGGAGTSSTSDSSIDRTPGSNTLNNTGGNASGGNGGSGQSNSITGTAICYAAGGGGGTSLSTSGSAGSGGSCSGLAATGGAGSKGPNTAGSGANGTGSGGGGAGFNGSSNGTSGAGGAGVVVLRYLTPATTTRNLITYVVDTYTATGKIIVTVPDSVTVGTYTENLTIKDAAGISTTYTITVNIAKATPTVALSIPGGGSTATYGSPVALNASSSTAGAATFKKGGTDLSGCVSKATSGGSATCSWTPTDTSTVTMSAAFTPTDTTNYNSVTSSNFVLSVNQADTLTVTFSNQTFTYSESGTAVSRAFTLAGVTSIDTVTAVATAITGTANDLTSVNVTGTANAGATGTSTLTKAGTFSLSGTGITFSGSTKASYYKAIAYSPGAITINKAGNPMTVGYGTNNVITYKEIGTETPTVTYKGTAAKAFSTTSVNNCSLDTSTGALTTLQSGSCDVAFSVAESANYLGDTVTTIVRINKATRTITAFSAATSLKYGETTTVSGTISAETSSATLSISMGSTTGCTIDPLTGTLTAISGTASCGFAITAAENNKYLSATSNTVSVTLNKADAPVLTLTPPANVNYAPLATSATMPRPTFTITGLKLTDTLTSLSDITINYVASGTYSYNSTTVPTGANTYSITPTAISLTSGSMSNYNTPTFSSVTWTINQINQETLTVKSLFQEGITVPYDIQNSGGSTNGAVTGLIVTGGTASMCAFVGINLRANSTGTCFIRLKMAGNQNYFDVYSDTYTVLIANFKQNIFNFDSLVQGAGGIAITSQVPITKGQSICSSNCQPKITAVSSNNVAIGDALTITGVNFATATEVIFTLDASVTTFTVDGTGTTIVVVVPVDAPLGAGGINVRSPSGLSPMYLGLTFR